jgi:predicted ester cyclase
MTPEESKRLVRRFFDEAVTGRRPELVDELVAEDFVRHHRAYGEETHLTGIGPLKRAIESLHTWFEGFYERVEQIVAEGDLVSCRVELGGRHQGTMPSPLGAIAPTGKQMRWPAYRFIRIADGKIAEIWSMGDDYGRLQQVGALPG